MSKPSETKSGTRKLSEVARELVLPSGIVSSGWRDINRQCQALGITFEAWQDGIGRGAFAKRADGVYAASVGGVCMSIPRQVGKTYLVGGIAFLLRRWWLGRRLALLGLVVLFFVLALASEGAVTSDASEENPRNDHTNPKTPSGRGVTVRTIWRYRWQRDSCSSRRPCC